MYKRYAGNDYASPRSAILLRIEHLDRESAASRNPSRNIYTVDAMIWCVRLAKLASRNHDPDSGSEFMKEAVRRCRTTGKADCSEETLLREMDKWDERTFG